MMLQFFVENSIFFCFLYGKFFFLPLIKVKTIVMNTNIKSVSSREILDSRGNPTVEVQVELECGTVATASVPSGASTGKFEACELRDGSLSLANVSKRIKSRYNGKGVLVAIENIYREISPAIIGMDCLNQILIDETMIALDGTTNKNRLGANAILAVSMAVCRAGAKALGIELFRYIGGANAHIMPLPMMNVINGGVHSDAPIDIQEFMIVPIRASNFAESVRIGAEVFHSLKGVLKACSQSTSVGDEGGFAPNLPSNEAAIEAIATAVGKAGYKFGKDIAIALDVASSEFYNEKTKKYVFSKSDNRELTASEMVDFLKELRNKYPIVSIEDGCAQDDWQGWQILTSQLGSSTQLVGDDLFVTNSELLRKGIDANIANAILVKINQIGTISEALNAVELAKRNSYANIISHRSGETCDTTIADIAVGVNAGQIKTGSLSRGERTCKYNRLMRIEQLLGKTAVFGGSKSGILALPCDL